MATLFSNQLNTHKMKKEVLKTDATGIERDLQKLETSAAKFQPLLDAMIKNDYAPDTKEFQEIIRGRNLKRDNPLDDFLRERTVKKHPSIDSLPITAFMKKTMIELPKECKHIAELYNGLPAQTSVLSDVYKLEIVKGKLCVTEDAKQAIIDRHTVYANERQYNAYQKTQDVLNALISLEQNFGINIFTQNLIQRATVGNLQGATLRAEAVNFVVSQFDRHQ